MRELIAYAGERGIRVHVAHLPKPYRGYYDGARHLIVIDFELTPLEQLEVLAHELGHAHHGHDCEDDPDFEMAADVFAAHLLIDPAAYARLEAITTDPDTVAEELGVTPYLLDVWQRQCLTSLRGVTYSRARMGVGQWSMRAVYA
jgi:Zn-dependent peptidase ImmA (M78 family)